MRREIGEVGDEAPCKVHRVYSESNGESLKSQNWKDDMIWFNIREGAYRAPGR